jgi:2',3'-cyclic-nucleotide 2'-phosphodiesterase (5'-nucleotidase family)
MGAVEFSGNDGHSWVAWGAFARVLSIFYAVALSSLLTCSRAQYSGDWGDYITFATRMREKADERGVDLLLIDTGDKVDGNGLYDGSSPKGKYTYDIFKEQHIDVLCTGNHELYKADAAEREYTKTVPNSHGNYLASNLDIIDPKSGERVPLAQRYRKFTTKNQGIRVLAFGFLFDFTGNSNNTFVQPVEETVKEDWFQQAIREDVDLFVVIGHVDLRAPEYKAIYTSIRSQKWDTPMQFFGGHSHIRNFISYDSNAYALESGRYMETIGWMAIDGISVGGKKKEFKDQASASINFKRRYIDNNLFGYYHHTGLNQSTFPTKHGREVSETIRKARKAMGLDNRFGCAPQDYFLNRAEYPSNSSILSWIDQQVLPDILVGENRTEIPRMAILNSGGIRFDIFEGPFTKDTVLIVLPFMNRFQYIKDVPYSAAKGLLTVLNSGGQVFESASLRPWLLAPPEQISIKEDILFSEFNENRHSSAVEQSPLGHQSDNEPSLVPGYTTKDDAGDDGDDTLHSPISFYRVPNCVQSNIAFPAEGDPETVDLVFLDFIQPFILLALRFLGQKYSTSDVLPYIGEQSFTSLLEGWVKEHWSSDC